jgi:hypothetical protein
LGGFRGLKPGTQELAVEAKRAEPVTKVELVKGPGRTAPVVMAVTVETR